MHAEKAHRELRVQTIASLAAWFERSLSRTLQRHGLSAARTTVTYLAGLLERFGRPEPLVAGSAGRALHRPLAEHWIESRLDAGSPSRALRRRGDLALFVCGVFPDYVSRRVTGHDYYLAMGRGAYAELAALAAGGDAVTWRELARGFPDFADALNAAVWGDGAPADPFTLYERWLAGNGRLARARFASLGTCPVSGPAGDVRH